MSPVRSVTHVSGSDPLFSGAGDGNRTHVRSLGSFYTAIVRRPLDSVLRHYTQERTHPYRCKLVWRILKTLHGLTASRAGSVAFSALRYNLAMGILRRLSRWMEIGRASCRERVKWGVWGVVWI